MKSHFKYNLFANERASNLVYALRGHILDEIKSTGNLLFVCFLFLLLACIGANAQKAKDTKPATNPRSKTTEKTSVADLKNAKKVKAIVKTQGVKMYLDLIGLTDKELVYVENFQKKTLLRDAVEGVNFILNFSRYDVKKLEKEKKFSEAATFIVNSVRDTIPYISLPENNVMDYLFDAAFLYLDAASVYDNEKSPQYDKQKAEKEYKYARWTFNQLAKAEWHHSAKIASLYVIYCQLHLGEQDAAANNFETIDEPQIGDASYGVYWMIDAMIKFNQSKLNEALDSAIKSVVFETKNIDTFPKALLFSAYCYEDTLDIYRAREVYFELARLFYPTIEGEKAFSSIRFIMDRKLTEEAEAVGIEKIFFDSVEDVNKKVNDFISEKLKEEEEKKNAKEEGEEEGEEEQQKDKEEKK